MWNRLTRFITFVIRTLIMWVSLFLRFTVPLLVRFAVIAVRLVVYSILLWFKGVLTATSQLAFMLRKKEVQDNPKRNPGPSNLEPVFDFLAYCVVVGELVVGWVLAAHLTVLLTSWLLTLIF